MFKFRKSSDTVLFTWIRWICLMLCVLGVLYYLVVELILAMLSFNYYMQTTEISVLDGFTEMPTVILCTTQASIKVGDWYDEQGLTTEGPQIGLASWRWVMGGNDTSMPIFSRPACADRHDGITIASFGEESYNRSSLAALRLIVTPNDPASNELHPVTLRVFPTRNAKLPANDTHPERTVYQDFGTGNLYYFLSKGERGPLYTIPKKTYLRRTDFLGLMGRTVSQPGHSISSSFNSFPIPLNESYLMVKVPLTNIEETQILMTTIPSALSSLGGAISLATGIFCAWFGSRRLDPFGCCRKLRRRKIKFTAQNGNASKGAMVDYPNQDAQSDQGTLLLENGHPFVEVLGEYYLDMELLETDVPAGGQAWTGV